MKNCIFVTVSGESSCASRSTIPELGATLQQKYDASNSDGEETMKVSNPAMVTYPFVDPDSNIEYCIVSIPLRDSRVDQKIKIKVINGPNGQVLQIKVPWPEELLDPKKMFPDSTLLSYHPKFTGLTQALKGIRSHYSEIPESLVEVKLPVKVETAPGSMKKDIIAMVAGGVLLRIEFQCVPDSYLENKKDWELVIPKKDTRDTYIHSFFHHL